MKEFDVNDNMNKEYIKEIKECWKIIFNSDENLNNRLANKKSISMSSSYLQSIINGCLQSDNEMFYEEYEDFNEIISGDDNFLNKLKREVADLNIQDVIKFDEDGCAITVYVEVITRFLF